MSDLPPSEGPSVDLPLAFRGYSTRAVEELVATLRARVQSLSEERDRLASRLGEFGTRDLEAEFKKLGGDVTDVLEKARQAAESLRERAAADAARWRSEALAEAESERRSARSDAEQMRGDAWNTAKALLDECQREADRLGAEAEKNSLRKVGEAERESHRLVAAGRREAEEVIRSARMEAERLTVAAQTQHDEIIETARRQAEAAQERTRALEQRRDELKKEIDSVRAALGSVEGEMEDKREQLGLSERASEDKPDSPPPRWTPGETVRVLRKAGEPRDDSEIKIVPAPVKKVERPVDPKASPAEFADALVSSLKTTPPVSEPAEAPEVEPAPEPAEEPEREPAVETAEEPAAEAAAEAGDEATPLTEVSGLFDRLRSTPASPPPIAEAAPPAAEAVPQAPAPEPEPEPAKSVRTPPGFEPFDLRDRLLLPVANRALRGIKRQLTEEQNIVLEQLRLDEAGWMPDPEEIAERVRGDLVVLEAESFAAGHAAAEEVSGERITKVSPPKSRPAEGFVKELVREINVTLEEGRGAGHGSRQLGSDVSRIFRAWRTDESERRLRDLSNLSYHAGFETALRSTGVEAFAWVVGGRGCATCRAAAEHPEAAELPPLHPGCSCTVVPG